MIDKAPIGFSIEKPPTKADGKLLFDLIPDCITSKHSFFR